jgi:site-specific DNA recombinase
MENTKNSSKKAVIYGRISTDETRQSIDRQANDLKRDAAIYGFEIVGVFNDQISGAKEAKTRPQFKKMMAFVESRNIKCIFITEISRLGRNNRDILNTLHDLHEVRKINLYIKDNGGFTLDEKGNVKPSIEFTINILAAVANQERKQLITRVNSGIRNKVRKGELVGRPPLGYVAENHQLIIKPEEAEKVKFVFNEFERLRSYRSVINSLIINDIQINKKSKKITTARIRNILTQKIYAGIKESMGVVTECPQIIDKEQFNRVQSLIKSRKTNHYHTNTKHLNPFKGVFKCGNCGSNLMIDEEKIRCHTTKAQYFNYTPKNKERIAISKQDVKLCPTIKADVIYSLFIDFVQNRINPEYIQKYRFEQITAIEGQQKSLMVSIEELEKDKAKADKDIEKQKELFRADIINIDELKSFIDGKKEQIKRIEDKGIAFNNQLSDLLKTLLKLRNSDNEHDFSAISTLTELQNFVNANITEITLKKADEQTAKEYAEKVYNHGLQVVYELKISGTLFSAHLLLSNRSTKYVEMLPDIQVKNETIIKGGTWFFADIKEFEKIDIS